MKGIHVKKCRVYNNNFYYIIIIIAIIWNHTVDWLNKTLKTIQSISLFILFVYAASTL